MSLLVKPRKRTETEASMRFGRLHLCNGLDPKRDGGMVPSILGMTGALARAGETITIVTPTPSRIDGIALPIGLRLKGPETDLEAAVRSAEVVHLHGLWQGHTRRGARAARSAEIPYLIAAHGMAEPWALRHKALKKKLYTAIVEGKNLRRAACLHALSRPEVAHLRALAPRTPICLVPNGVDLRPFDHLPDRTVFEADYPETAGKFLLLFYGRLHVKKGLDLLANAIATLGTDYPDLHLLLAGNDDGALEPFRTTMAANGRSNLVTVLGHVSGERARTVWGAADAFILPSYSEGFSMAILEALAARLPVIATTSCHFPDLATEDAGIVVEPTEAGVAAGLRGLLERSESERNALAARGRFLVESQYTWDKQSRKLADVYRWVSRGGSAPDAVDVAGGL